MLHYDRDMKDATSIFLSLKSSGYRLTRGRKAIVTVLFRCSFPISPVEIADCLRKQNIFLNKTTVYRELEFLKKQKIIKEVQFDERNKRYELLHVNHHHHIVCKKCKRVVEFNNKILEKNIERLVKVLERVKRFQHVEHSLELFGLCEKC